jgi:hypothetical protein
MPFRLVVPLLCLLLLSCSADRKSHPTTQAETKHLATALVPLDSGGTFGVNVRFEFPEFLPATPAPLVDSLRGVIARNVFASLEGDEGGTSTFDALAGELRDEYLELREEFPDYAIPWELTRKGTILFDSAGIVTLRFDEYSYLGGAHGMQISRFISFESKSGHRLSEEDLFRPGSAEALSRGIEEEFRRIRGIKEGVSLSDAGFWVEEGKFPVSPIWGVCSGGILFYYPAYEIGPYALGPTEVRVPLERMRPLFRDDGVLRP